MIRRAFTMKLKPGALSEYRRQHDNIWPEMIEAIAKSGIASMTIYHSGENLVLFSEIRDSAAWDRLWNSKVSKRWSKAMAPLMFQTPDGFVESGELTEIFHLSAKPKRLNASAKKSTARKTKSKRKPA